MPVNKQNFERVLTIWAEPSKVQEDAIDKVQMAAKWMVAAILDYCPPCADQQAAIRQVREALGTAVEAICLNGEV